MRAVLSLNNGPLFAALLALALGVLACSPAAAAPAAAGDQLCIALSDEICAAMLDAAKAASGADVLGFRIRCTAPICDVRNGSLAADILWSDGTRTQPGFQWGNGSDIESLRRAMQPVPTPPVPPTCLRVSQEQCDASWADAVRDIDRDRISSVAFVIVECTTTCNSSESGKGRTIVQFEDGTRLIVAEWK
jgi:hypothetical protein